MVEEEIFSLRIQIILSYVYIYFCKGKILYFKYIYILKYLLLVRFYFIFTPYLHTISPYSISENDYIFLKTPLYSCDSNYPTPDGVNFCLETLSHALQSTPYFFHLRYDVLFLVIYRSPHSLDSTKLRVILISFFIN